MNKKTFVLRVLLGFPLGVAINATIALLISWCNGVYAPVSLELAEAVGGQLQAAAIQYVSSGLLGAAFAGASAFFEAERWSITRQTVTHFLLTFTATLVCTLLNRWVPLRLGPVMAYVGIWIALYVAFWVALTTHTRRKVNRINAQLQGQPKQRP